MRSAPLLIAVVVTLASASCGKTEPIDLPAPTGPHAVGRSTFHWVDASRAESMTDAPDDSREVTVHFWYPTEGPSGALAPYIPDRAKLEATLDERTRELFDLTRGHARLGGAILNEPALHPVVILSHGNDMLGAQYTSLAEELVSHGFVVVGIDHPYDARAVALADGRSVGYLASRWPPLSPPAANGEPDVDSEYARFYRERVLVRAADARFVLDEIARLGPAFSPVGGHVDLERVAFVGHSVGGVAAGEACRSDPRFKACVNLDGESPSGPFSLDDQGGSFAQPFMMVTKPFDVPDAQLARWGLDRASWQAALAQRRETYFGSVAGGSIRVVLAGASHASFSDEPFVVAQLEEEPEAAAHRRRIDLLRAYVVAFVARHLRGDAAPMLEAPPPPGAEVQRWPGTSG